MKEKEGKQTMLLSECQELFSTCFPFWGGLSHNDKELLSAYTMPAYYQRGQNIYGGNGECKGGILVKSGCIRAYLLSEDGREITLYRLYPGDICMLSASCVLQAITFDVHVDAVEDSSVYIVNGHTFQKIADRNIEAQNFALQVAVTRFSEVMWVMQQILFMSFDKRLAFFLIDEVEKTKSRNIKMTQEQIASYVGSAREVVSRMLKYFSSEGMVELYRGGIRIVDEAKLEALAKS